MIVSNKLSFSFSDNLKCSKLLLNVYAALHVKRTQLRVRVCVAGWLFCLQSVHLPSHPPAVIMRCARSLADHREGRLNCASLRMLPFSRRVWEPFRDQETPVTRRSYVPPVFSPSPSAWRRNLFEKPVLGNSWKQAPGWQCGLIKRKTQKAFAQMWLTQEAVISFHMSLLNLS